LLATAPGVLKEVYDAQHPDRHTASVGDLTADLVGAFAGAWVGPQLHLRVHARRTEVIFSRSF
jgi:VanZ family protein